MSKKNKQHHQRLARALSVGSVLVAAVGAADAQSLPQVQLAQPQNVVSISASATVEVPKDQLSIVFSTTRDGPDATQVQSALKQALDAALAEARKSARPNGQIEVQTGNFSLYPRYGNKGTPTGWTGTAELIVEGKDIVGISQLAGRIQTLTVARTGFGLSREARERVEADVVNQAIANFKLKADQVSRAFGFGGWALREVNVQGTEMHSPQPMMMKATRAAMAPADESLPVEAGKQQVVAHVSGSIQLSPR